MTGVLTPPRPDTTGHNYAGGDKSRRALAKRFGAKFTLDKWRVALQMLRAGKSPQAAADTISVTRSTLLSWRHRSDEMAAEWLQAIEGGTDRVEDEAHRRAVEGVEKPVFGRVVTEDGASMEQIGTVTEYSDALMNVILKARRPEKYRDNFTVSGDPNSPIQHRVVVAFVAAPPVKTIEHE